MSDVTDSELLRLARKAFPPRPEMGEDERDVPESIDETRFRLELSSATGAAIIEFQDKRPLAREALHAALLVLAGELDVDALRGKS